MPSAMLVTSLLTLCVGASLAFAASRYPPDLRSAIHLWIGGLTVGACALLSAALRGPWWNHAGAIVVTNTMYAASFAMMGQATDRLAPVARVAWRWRVVVLIGVVQCVFTVLWPLPRWRVVADALPLAVLQFGVARAVWRTRARRSPADALTHALFVACGTLALVRGAAELLAPSLGADPVRGVAFNVVLVSSLVLPMLGTIGFMLMCGDRMNDELQRLAMTDPLTGVANRRTLAGVADAQIAGARRAGHAVSLLAIDVDHFKKINDACGHDGGDDALRALVRLMQEALPDGCAPARIGGEEFAVLLPGRDEPSAAGVAEAVREHVAAALVPIGHHAQRMTVSIGVAEAVAGVGDLRVLLRNADRALYAAKGAGRNRCVAYSALDDDGAIRSSA